MCSYMKYQTHNTTHPTTLPNCLNADDATTVAGEELELTVAAGAPPLDSVPADPDVAAAELAPDAPLGIVE